MRRDSQGNVVGMAGLRRMLIVKVDHIDATSGIHTYVLRCMTIAMFTANKASVLGRREIVEVPS